MYVMAPDTNFSTDKAQISPKSASDENYPLNAMELNQIFRDILKRVDTDRDGNATSKELYRAAGDDWTSREGKALTIMANRADMLSQLADDGFGLDRRGISTNDMKEFGRIAKTFRSRLSQSDKRVLGEIEDQLKGFNQKVDYPKLSEPTAFGNAGLANFQIIDSNKDGQLSRDELTAAAAAGSNASDVQVLSTVMADDFDAIAKLSQEPREVTGITKNDLLTMPWAMNESARLAEYKQQLQKDNSDFAYRIALSAVSGAGCIILGAATVLSPEPASKPILGPMAFGAGVYSAAQGAAAFSGENKGYNNYRFAQDKMEQVREVPYFWRNRRF
jgi:hypothetical protein